MDEVTHAILPRNAAASIAMIRNAARRFGPELLSRMAFLGGASLPLLLTDPAVSEVRPTQDVDVIVEVLTYGQYADLADQLRHRGFNEDTTPKAPICRWVAEGLLVDVMPTDENILGFSNRWYRGALASAQDYPLSEDGGAIRLIKPFFFLATKLEAYAHRGAGDLHTSHDIEDIVTLVDGRPALPEEVSRDAPKEVRDFVASFFQQLFRDPGFAEAVEGHLPYDARERLAIVLSRMKQMT